MQLNAKRPDEDCITGPLRLMAAVRDRSTQKLALMLNQRLRALSLLL